MNNIGMKIAEYRKRVGMTQEKLAEVCNVSRQAVTKWESGNSVPDVEKLCRLADVFHIPLDVIVRDAEERKDCELGFDSDMFYKVQQDYLNGDCCKQKLISDNERVTRIRGTGRWGRVKIHLDRIQSASTEEERKTEELAVMDTLEAADKEVINMVKDGCREICRLQTELNQKNAMISMIKNVVENCQNLEEFKVALNKIC